MSAMNLFHASDDRNMHETTVTTSNWDIVTSSKISDRDQIHLGKWVCNVEIVLVERQSLNRHLSQQQYTVYVVKSEWQNQQHYILVRISQSSRPI